MFRRFFFPAILLGFLTSCAGYEPVPWKDAGGRSASVSRVAGALVSALEAGASAHNNKPNQQGRRLNGGSSRSLKVLVGAFSEARTGARTEFSLRMERAFREALGRSPLFTVIDEGEGVSWQEAGLAPEALKIPTGARGIIGLPKPNAKGRTLQRDPLDDDHPVRGLWPKVRRGAYGENSAVFASSLLGADAAVYGGYALSGGRVRVWSAAVLNQRPSRRYLGNNVKNVFGAPEGLELSRPYLGFARGYLPRRKVPDAWLTARVRPNPRHRPRHPDSWAAPKLEVLLERIDAAGRRVALIGGEEFGPQDLVVGKVGVSSPLFVYGFALRRSGELEEIFAAPGGGKPKMVRPGKEARFTARLLPSGQVYRVYFVASKSIFEAKEIAHSVATRLGISLPGIPRAGKMALSRPQSLPAPSPAQPWFVPHGQERLILPKGDEHFVYWFHRKGEN